MVCCQLNDSMSLKYLITWFVTAQKIISIYFKIKFKFSDTTRKVHLDSSAKKNMWNSRVKLTLDIKVTCCDFHKDSSTIHCHFNNVIIHITTLLSFSVTTIPPNIIYQMSWIKIEESVFVEFMSYISRRIKLWFGYYLN